MPASIPRIALTSGEPAGVGPELCLAIAQRNFAAELICLADRDLLARRARQIGLAISLRDYEPQASQPHRPGSLTVLHQPLAAASTAGVLDKANSPYVLALLDRALAGALSGEFSAITTAPVHKGIINEAGVSFIGHTEYFAEKTNTPRPVMLLAADALRVALATTHLPLREVSGALTVDSLCATAAIIDADLRKWWGIEHPRLGICGLNPHAGEGGYLGDEEIRVITPAIDLLRANGIRASGPLPADTAFVPHVLARFDVILAMYHDQGLPVIKHSGFDRSVNITLGLPVLRTSVDHGTALDLAGTGKADIGSLESALRLALNLAERMQTRTAHPAESARAL